MIAEIAVETRSVPADWFHDDYMVATLYDVLEQRASAAERSAKEASRGSKQGSREGR